MRPALAAVAGAAALLLTTACAGDGSAEPTAPTSSTAATYDPDAPCPSLAAEAVAGEIDERMQLVSGSADACVYGARDEASEASVRVTVDASAVDPDVAVAAARDECGLELVEYDVGERSFACGSGTGGRAYVHADGVSVVVEVTGIGGSVTATSAAGELIRAAVLPPPTS